MLKAKTMIARRARKEVSAFSLRPSAFACSGFTMVEIAISLAIIGIALISIIGVLPIGMHTQRDNREETLINQDATVFIEAIRGSARGLDDLTNYVFAITNYWTNVTSHANGINGYTFANASIAAGYYASGAPITNGLNVVGVLSTPEYADTNGMPLPNLYNGGYSNHVVAYVRSLSGPAVEKPPQANDLMRADSFGYRLFCVNAPVAMLTPPPWQNQPGSYNYGDSVTYYLNGQATYWQATANTGPGDIPGSSPLWKRIPYPQQLAANLRELRLTFYWPLLPNNSLPGDFKHQTYRSQVAGQMVRSMVNTNLYFYQSHSFTNMP